MVAVSAERFNGVDPDESFDLKFTLVSADGAVLPVSDWTPIAWSRWIDLPSAPSEGTLDVQVRRRDRPDIAASIAMPIAAGQDLDLDLRSPPR